MQQEEMAMGSTQQGLDMESLHETDQEVVQQGGVSSPKGKNKARTKSSVQGVQCVHAELAIVMPKIPKGVKIDDNMVAGVDILKYSDHDVLDTIKIPYLATQIYLESRG